ncbi:hypothetical protein BJ170DRAFT_602895 [Xylariales sp. AK1849]|nr:hypothetical protein BJ170DRAFT_602895 [Xylariales sp. AK1849]
MLSPSSVLTQLHLLPSSVRDRLDTLQHPRLREMRVSIQPKLSADAIISSTDRQCGTVKRSPVHDWQKRNLIDMRTSSSYLYGLVEELGFWFRGKGLVGFQAISEDYPSDIKSTKRINRDRGGMQLPGSRKLPAELHSLDREFSRSTGRRREGITDIKQFRSHVWYHGKEASWHSAQMKASQIGISLLSTYLLSMQIILR